MPNLDERMEDFQKGYPVRFYIKQESERVSWKQLRDQINSADMTFSAVYSGKYRILFIYRTNKERGHGITDETRSVARNTPGGIEPAGRNEGNAGRDTGPMGDA